MQAQTFVRLLRHEGAATSIEYAMIAAGIAVAIAGAVSTVGGTVKAMYERIQNAMG